MGFVSVFLMFFFFVLNVWFVLSVCLFSKERRLRGEVGEVVEGNGREETMIGIYCLKNYFRQYVK